MEFFLLLKEALKLFDDIPPGIAGFVVAALFAFIWIGQSLRRDKQESKLITQLQESLNASSEAMKAATDLAERERTRADNVSRHLLALTEQSARSEALLASVTERLKLEMQNNATMRERIQALELTVERLVQEIRTKDRSINELITLNRQLLSSLPLPPR